MHSPGHSLAVQGRPRSLPVLSATPKALDDRQMHARQRAPVLASLLAVVRPPESARRSWAAPPSPTRR